MSRSTFLMTNDIPTTTDRCYHHGLMSTNRSNENLPIVIQSSTTKSIPKSNLHINPRLKRNLRGKRRPTGIHPDQVTVASTSTEGSANDDDDDDDNDEGKVPKLITEPHNSFDDNRKTPSSHSSQQMFTMNRIQSSFDNLSITGADSYIMTSSSTANNPGLKSKLFLPDDFILRRTTSNDDSITLTSRQFEERIRHLESLLCDKDSIIHDLEHKANKLTQDLNDAQEQIYILHQEKLTLIKAFTTLQDNKTPSGDISIRSSFKKH